MRIKWDKVGQNVYSCPWAPTDVFIPLSRFCSCLSNALAPLSFHSASLVALPSSPSMAYINTMRISSCLCPALIVAFSVSWLLFHLDCAHDGISLHPKVDIYVVCAHSVESFWDLRWTYLLSVYHSFTSIDLIIFSSFNFLLLIFNLRVIIFKYIL